MAALLRQGAKRIGGSVLQRTQAAVTPPAAAEERRLLVSRRMTTVTRQQVQKKKEELYEVLSQVESWGNRGLLQDLAVHVNPRPDDTQWRRLKVARRISNFVDATGMAVFVSFVALFNDVMELCRNSEAGENGEGKSSEIAGCNV